MKKMFCEYCGELLSNGCDCHLALEELAKSALEDYYNDLEVQRGWAQQDLIDTYRRER